MSNEPEALVPKTLSPFRFREFLFEKAEGPHLTPSLRALDGLLFGRSPGKGPLHRLGNRFIEILGKCS